MAFSKAAEFRLLQGQEALTDDQHAPANKTEPFLHLTFCKRCGIRAFSKGGEWAQTGGEFYAINLACLDGATDAELSRASIHYANGRDDEWQKEAPESSYL